MENFAAVVRSLLVRIRAYQASRAETRPSSAAAEVSGLRYRVAPTMWGVGGAGGDGDRIEAAGAVARPLAPATARRRRRPLELTVYGLPVPRGLPAT